MPTTIRRETRQGGIGDVEVGVGLPGEPSELVEEFDRAGTARDALRGDRARGAT